MNEDDGENGLQKDAEIRLELDPLVIISQTRKGKGFKVPSSRTETKRLSEKEIFELIIFHFPSHSHSFGVSSRTTLEPVDAEFLSKDPRFELQSGNATKLF